MNPWPTPGARAVLVLALTALPACEPDAGPAHLPPLPALSVPTPEPAGGCPEATPLKRAYFGDTHVHTRLSIDAIGFGTTALGPRDAIRFARGETVRHPLGEPRRLDRPLDFVVTTDHAEWADVVGMCLRDRRNPAWDHEVCRTLRARPGYGLSLLNELNVGILGGAQFPTGAPERGLAYVWHEIQNAANEAHAPCVFTTFVGYEWTGGTASFNIERSNLHRNVVFANHKVPALPADARRYPHESDLWTWLEEQCPGAALDGCDAVTIPHNSNLSRGGGMWLVENLQQARQRARWDRLVEIFQHKGDSECANDNLDPADGSFDPACEFEKIRFRSIADAGLAFDTGDVELKPRMVRAALQQGLEYYERHGLNPLAFGIVAGTDTHNATAGDVAESSYRGHQAFFLEANAAIRLQVSRERSPGGLSVLWAEENTRRALFAAMQRREAYGTSGPRIELRFYAAPTSGNPCHDSSFPAALEAQAAAVPMGSRYEATARPWWIASARADATPLERLQLIVLRAEADGSLSEAVTDIAVAPAGGTERLCAAWQEPADDPERPLAVYARVLETPTPRWSYFACLRHPDLCRDQPGEWIRERAWSSPIWRLPPD